MVEHLLNLGRVERQGEVLARPFDPHALLHDGIDQGAQVDLLEVEIRPARLDGGDEQDILDEAL